MQKTLEREISTEGTGLHSGRQARMTLAPAPINSGFFFTVAGGQGEIKIPALVENVDDSQDLVRATNLTRHGVQVHTVEHVLAALAGMGLTNCEIRLEGGEPPVPSCGSAQSYVEMIEEAGIQEQGLPAGYFKVNHTISWRDGEVQLTAEPAADFILSFRIEYNDPGIGIQEATFKLRPDVFKEEIAPARTFALLKDVPDLQEMGLAKGGSLENALVFDDGKLVGEQTLRFADECVRHKILDLLGDLALLGMPIQGHIKARLSGHAGNVAFTRTLARIQGKSRPIYPPPKPEFWDIGSIMGIMPHRYPFLLVDRITELEPGKRVVGIKNVTINEPFFQGHFPGHPIMPAVLIIEAMAQTGGVFLLSSLNDSQGKLVYFSGIDEARFRQPVVPGDQLRFELELLKLRGTLGKMRGTAWVGDKKVAEAILMSTVVDK
jgi:UDP-3-O-[3-hydroxymyristoyl] N-acetylglucosamine deacetylase/3-hydroxyacyl-[acyl-carrier-protein] dehydratase